MNCVEINDFDLSIGENKTKSADAKIKTNKTNIAGSHEERKTIN